MYVNIALDALPVPQNVLFTVGQFKYPRDSIFVPLTVYNLGGSREGVQVDLILRNTSTRIERRIKRVNLPSLSRGRYIESLLHVNLPSHNSSSFPFGEYEFLWRVDPRNLICLLYTSPSPRDKRQSRMPSSA